MIIHQSIFFENINIYPYSEEYIDGKDVIIAIGNNILRRQISQKIKKYCNFISLAHKSSYISKFSTIGEGTVVMPKACINADVKIGKHCIINTASVIDHECVIGDYVHVSPNVSMAGNVVVESGVHIGIGAIIIQGIIIGENSIIGAGAVVLADVPSNSVVVGNPAKILKNI